MLITVVPGLPGGKRFGTDYLQEPFCGHSHFAAAWMTDEHQMLFDTASRFSRTMGSQG
jgi:hypothetical protein